MCYIDLIIIIIELELNGDKSNGTFASKVGSLAFIYISEYPSSHPLVKNIAVFNITKKEMYQILISIRVCDCSECTPFR